MSAPFTYTGEMDGRSVEGRVENGRISGNPFVAIRVRALVDNSVHIGLGPWSGPATLDDPNLARATIAAIIPWPSFDPPLEPDPLPEGAVS